MAQAAEQLLRRGPQVHHVAASFERLAVGLAHSGTAASGQHGAGQLAQGAEGLNLQLAESGLAMLLKIGPDRAADLALDLLVTVHKTPAQLAGQLAANSGFAAARHADQGHWTAGGRLRAGGARVVGWRHASPGDHNALAGAVSHTASKYRQGDGE